MSGRRFISDKYKYIALLLLLALGLGGCGAREPDYQKYTKSYFGAFDTVTIITGFARSEAEFERAAGGAFETLMRYHRACDAYNAHAGINNLYYVNAHAAQAPVKAADELFEVLTWTINTQPLSRGRVNVALGAALMLWHDYREAGEALPPMSALEDLARHSNIDDVIFDEANRTVYYKDAALKIDLGAVAKGCAVEAAARALLAGDMPSFIISAGGNVRAGQKPLDGRDNWRVSIQDPNGGAEYVDTLDIRDMSAVTSGDYQRYYTVDGARYHHIIDPDTLMPSNFMRSATVITRDSALADLLSTALFLMPLEEALALAESLSDVEAYLISNEGIPHTTSGITAYTQEPEAK